MKLEHIYNKDINREVNPAVNASNLSTKTVEIEIGEYVFTDDIINNLYEVLSAIKDRSFSHNGMWISGYFGSGKSHFLKYVKYCLDRDFSECAMERFKLAVAERDPLQVPESNSKVSISDANDLALWLRTANIDTILFNIGSVANVQGNERRVFLDVFWNEFNRMRGYNNNNLALAQYFEKVLDEKGKFEEFKERINSELGFVWEDDCITLATTELDMILEIDKELVPTLTIDIIRDKIASREITLTVETFVAEIKAFINKQPDNYRLIFLVDEISQFIDNRPGLLLQLQQIVSDIHTPCEGKAWVACTAQQDLSEIVDSCNINKASDDYGKIMGRFQVQVSLKGTSTEYITQRRILEKTADATIKLNSLYSQKKNAIEAQLNLPAGYRIFADSDDFINYYPFVPYQFKLMGNIFDSFVALEFVNREVKGNERSIIKVTHSTAKDTKEQELGNFISFDQFYNSMFSQGLSAKGVRAVSPAEDVAKEYADPQFALRVVHVLFMLCYMSEQHRMVFSATADNITTLLMQDIDCRKLTLKNDIQAVLDFLVTNNIIRKENRGAMEVYSFYSEDEREVASTIKSQQVDTDSRAKTVTDIFKEYLVPANRETLGTSSVNVGVSIMGKELFGSNHDVKVEFVFDNLMGDVNTFALSNSSDRLVFYMADLYNECAELKNIFHWFCQVDKYLKTPAQSEARQKTNMEFRAQANDVFRNKIAPKFKELFDKSVVISGNQIIDNITVKGKEKYKAAIQRHLGEVYSHAQLIGHSAPSTNDSLKNAILRPIEANAYGELNPLSDAEKMVKSYIDRQGGVDVLLSDVITIFQKRPYGWNEYAIIYLVNELVRRRIYEFAYNNNTDIDRSVIANNIVREKNKFTIKPARAISAELVARFTACWKDIFNTPTVPGCSDHIEMYNKCRDDIGKRISDENALLSEVSAYPFAKPLRAVVAMLTEWQAIRDYTAFFEKVVVDSDVAKEVVDNGKMIREFCKDQLANYKQCCQFAHDNDANWGDLDAETQQVVVEFKGIVSDELPISKMPMYLRHRRMLSAKLEEVKANLRERIAAAYTETAGQLEKMAAELGVPYTSNVDGIIEVKVKAQNIANLKLNCNTDSYYQAEAYKITSSVPTPQPTPQPAVGDASGSYTPAPTPAPAPRVKSVRLTTRSTSKLASAADVDNYLNSLRSQLMSHIDNGEEIIVM